MAKRAAIYVRISSDPTVEAAGVARQENDCRRLAAAKGWEVTRVYPDNDVSAFNGKIRPQYLALLEDMKAGDLDAVVVWHEDRLHRQPRELEGFIDLANSKQIQLATVTGDIDLATPEGRLRARMLGNVGAYESEHKAARIRRKHEQLAAEGRISGGGDRPFGYDDDRKTIRTPEARLVREATKHVLAGGSLRSLCVQWNARGLRTTAGNPWYPSGLRVVLMSARISGQREHHGEIVAKAEWPGIITVSETARLRAVLGDPARRTNRTARRYLLAGGLARCGRCGKRLVSRPRADKARCYVCASGVGYGGCGKIRVLSEPLEELVMFWLFKRLETPKLAAAIAKRSESTPDDGVTDDIAADEAQLVDLAREWAAKHIGRAEWLAARDDVQRRLDSARSRITKHNGTAAITEFMGKTDTLAKRWNTLDFDRKRSVVAAVLDFVTVGPAASKGPVDARPGRKGRRMFDPRRVEPVWRT